MSHDEDCQGLHNDDVSCQQAINLRADEAGAGLRCQFSPTGSHGFTPLHRRCCYKPCETNRDDLETVAD